MHPQVPKGRAQMATQFSHEASRGTIYMALTEHLAMSKVCAHCVPRQLIEGTRTLRIGWVLEFLTQYHMKWNELIERIVTGNKSRIHFWTPETKAQSKVWKKKVVMGEVSILIDTY